MLSIHLNLTNTAQCILNVHNSGILIIHPQKHMSNKHYIELNYIP